MRQRSKERLGILGGTFNPVHIGHLVLAQSALEIFDLSRVLFVPCSKPPHKSACMLAQARHRLAMLESALEDELRFDLCDVEIRRGGTSYTIETVRELRRHHPQAELCFIIGSDTLPELHLWRDIEQLLELCTFLTLCRPGTDFCRLSESDIHLPPPWPERLLENMATGRIMDISSSDIRHRVAEGLTIRYLVPMPVEVYIAEHSLYGG